MIFNNKKMRPVDSYMVVEETKGLFIYLFFDFLYMRTHIYDL